MGRHPRIEGKSLVYYISAKGRNGQHIFKDEKDRTYFISLLNKQKIKSKLVFYAYTLLPELYACLLETNKNNLVQTMHRINSDYANYFNRRHRSRHKLFHDRYNCYIIEKKRYLAAVSRHIHLLPVKKAAVKRPQLYEWSSYSGYISCDWREDWIHYDCILSQFSKTAEAASSAYKHYIEAGIKTRLSSPFVGLRKGIILGSEKFKQEISAFQNTDGIQDQKDEFALARKIIKLVDLDCGWPSIRAKRKRIARAILSRNAAIYFLKKFTDLSNQQICRFFAPLKVSSISQMSRRFHLIKEDNTSLKKIADALESKIKIIALSENQ